MGCEEEEEGWGVGVCKEEEGEGGEEGWGVKGCIRRRDLRRRRGEE